MNKKLLLLFIAMLSAFNFLKAQSIAPTGFKQPCSICVPDGWVMGVGSVDVSNNTNLGGTQLTWNPSVPKPPSWAGQPYASFITSINNTLGVEERAFTVVSGLIVGQKYRLKYNVISLRQGNGGYGTSATISASNGATGAQQTDFVPPGDPGTGFPTSIWVERLFQFTASATTARITFSGTGGNPGGYVGLDIKSSALSPCSAGVAQVQVNPTLTNVCPATTVNLNDAVTSGIPSGASVVWHDNPQHTGGLYSAFVNQSGVYYAFFYDLANNCYNTDNSTAKVTVNINPVSSSGQVVLNKTSIINACPVETADLTTAFTGQLPAQGALIWYKDASHSGPVVLDPSNVTAGTYYAFFVDVINNCYNTNNSTAKVTVTTTECCQAGTNQVPVSPIKLKNICPAQLVDLAEVFDPSLVPDGCVIRFYSTANHAPGTVVPGDEILGAEKWNVGVSGMYYAFYYDEEHDCFNTDNSTAAIQVTITPCPPPCNAGTVQVRVDHKLSAQCPAATVNLNDAAPAVSQVITWFTNSTHSGSPVANPSMAPAPGTYYAFYYDQVNDCWNTDNSTAVVSVVVIACPPCNAGNKQVPLIAPFTLTNICPAVLVDLGTKFGGTAPNGSSLVFYTTANHAPGTVVTGSTIGGVTTFKVNASGTYYAFFYDAINDCFNTNNSTSAIVVTINTCHGNCNAGTQQVALSGETNFEQKCPSSTFNLNNTFTGSVPAGTSLVWFTNALHAGPVVPNPTAVSAGFYFAFFYDAIGNCYNTDISDAKVTVTAPPQFGLSKTSTGAVCPATTVNLNALFMGSQPVGSVARWFTNSSHTGPQIADPTMVPEGTYYAFFYFDAEDCYNTDNSIAKVTVNPVDCDTCNAGVTPVQLIPIALSGPVSNTCPVATVNLNDYVWGAPPIGATVKWFTAVSHAPGTEVADPAHVGAGKYYPFFYDAVNDCYNTQPIYVDVVINDCGTCNAGTEQVHLNTDKEVIKFCPSASINLNDYFNGLAPGGASLVWFDNKQHIGNPLSPIQSPSVQAVYYAFFFDEINNCYNTAVSQAKLAVMTNFQVFTAGCNDVDCEPIISCNQTFNLTSVIPAVSPYDPFPVSVSVVWFDNNTHTGSPIANPTAVGTSGTYYAFYYDSVMDCYNKAVSTASVQITVLPCASTVQLGLKVALQGAMPNAGTDMLNNLQNNEFLGCNLPTTDPYGGSAQYLDICNENGVAGKVVDWVKVELYDILTLAPLESKSLLLKIDGSVVDINGNVPSFGLQVNGVFIIVKHRNHVTIMSQAINFNTPQVYYDFRIALSRAYNEAQGPDVPPATPQMTQINGVWSMNAGDGNSDLGVDNQDAFIFYDSFDKGEWGYKQSDFNLDGSVDNVDSYFFNTNFDIGSYSILLNLQLP